MIPADDDITKTQLWQRIDETILMIQNINQQFLSQVTDLPATIQAQINSLLDEREKKWASFPIELNDMIGQAKKDFQVQQETSLNELKKLFIEDSVTLDQRNKEFLIQVQTKVQTAIDGYIEYVTQRLNDVSDNVIRHQTENENAIKAYQANLLQKIGELQERFDMVMQNLRVLSKIVA